MADTRRAGVLGVFAFADQTAAAVRAVREAGVKKFTVFSPVPDHHLAAAIGKPVSPMGYATLIGAIVGLVSGFALAHFTHHKWELIVGGKPYSAWLPWLVVGFEFMILMGSLTNFVTMILSAGLPRLKPTPRYDPRFTEDRYGVFVPCGPDRRAAVAELLRAQGAAEVHEHD